VKKHFAVAVAALAISLIAASSIVSGQATCDKSDYDCQIRLYRDQIAANSKNAEAYYSLGLALQNKDQYAESITVLTAYIDSGVTNTGYLADGYSLRGYAYARLEDHERAVSDYTRAIGYAPTNSSYYYQRGRAYNSIRKFDLSIPDFTKALSLSPNGSSAYFGRGYAYMEQKTYPLAIDDFTKAISLDPMEDEAFYNRGTIYYRQAKYNLAIADLDKYIDLNKANKNNLADGYLNRGLAYHYSGSFDRAVADFSSAIGLNPSMKNAYTNRATSYRKLNKVALATADETTAAELQP